jgi:hypothetical protein
MTVGEFLNQKTITAVETINTLIVNLVCGEELYGINVDLTHLLSGTAVNRTTTFHIIDGVLMTNGASVNLNDTEMLSDI